MHLSFAQPLWLGVAALASMLLVALFSFATRKRQAAISAFNAARPESSASPLLRHAHQALRVSAIALICVALARPFSGFHWEQTPRSGFDLMFAVDTSKSMKATDISPDRLTRAKLAVADLVKKSEDERFGLIAFAGEAFVQTPMTADRGVFMDSLAALDTDVIPRGGTDLASAIHAAEQAMGSEPDRRKTLILLSDGEDLEGSAVDVARDAARHGLTIDTVGVGSRAGSLITTGSGDVVRSHLDEATLRLVAESTGGIYQQLGADGHGLDAMLKSAEAHLAPSTHDDRRRVLDERFGTPLALAITCLMLDLLLGERKKMRLHKAALAMALAAFPFPGHAQGIEAYNAGTAAYRKGDFHASEKQFESSLRTSDVKRQADAYYDLGNTQYRLGEASLKTQREATIESWKKALRAYDGTLALSKEDGDAKFNRDFVSKKLAALEEQKKRDEQSKPSPQKNPEQPKSGGASRQENSPGASASSGQQQQGQGQSAQAQSTGSAPKSGQGAQPKSGDAKSAGNQGQTPEQSNATTGREGRKPQEPRDSKSESPTGDKQNPGNKEDSRGEEARRSASSESESKGNDKLANMRSQLDVPDAASSAKVSASQAQAAAATTQSAGEQHAAEDAAHRAAGELTRTEALQLLDSVQPELKPLPIRSHHDARADTYLKDW